MNKLIFVIVFLIIGLIGVLVLASGEEFAEKLLPLFFGVVIIGYLAASWYLGYFIATQKPSSVLIITALVAIVLTFFSGLYIGRKV